MVSGEELRSEYAELTRTADEARRRYDELLLSLDTTPEELDQADAEAKEAERARDRTGKRLRKAIPESTNISAAMPVMGLITPSLLDLSPPSTRRPRSSRPTRSEPRVAKFRSGQRDEVADVLSLYGAPARTQGVIAGIRELHGGDMTTAKMAQLRREELRQFRRAHTDGSAVPRPWYLVPCVSADTLIAAPGTFALSTWPLPDRMITPQAPRLWTAQTAINLATYLLRAETPLARAGVEALLRTLLRGTKWGLSEATLAETSGAARKTRSADQLKAVIEDAGIDAGRLLDLHHPAAVAAQERLEEVARRGGDEVLLWGMQRVRPLESGEAGA
jgi:hypothetical protein